MPFLRELQDKESTMRAVNLYILTRLSEEGLYADYEKALSWRTEKKKIRKEEMDIFRVLVDKLMSCDKREELLSSWFYSFEIPQIAKEFDLIKLGENKVAVNIEIKSQAIEEERVIKQLKQNQYYLSHVADKIYSFAYIREDEKQCQLYCCNGTALQKCSLDELIKCLNRITLPIVDNIESMFRPKDYLISPLNTPDKFLGGNYYLTAQQDEIKREVLLAQNGEQNIWGINGAAGTGKTLLLYDLAKELSKKEKVCVIHSGMLSEGHQYINSHMNGVVVRSAKDVSKELIRRFSIICVDEAQRLYWGDLNTILEAYTNGEVSTCIFSYDYAQVLSKAEYRRNNPQRLNEVEGFRERKLTDRIRTNKEVFSFIRNMLRLNDTPKARIAYDNIDIHYANNCYEVDVINSYYKRCGYIFIALTPSQYVSNSIDHYAENINSHQVIGQEFDKVVVVLDNNFRYSSEGVLEGKEHPNPDYLFPRLFYQNITRAREKLCIIVCENEELFVKLLAIKNHTTG